MKRIFVILLLLAFTQIHAQKDIKRIIYEDLFLLNDIHGCLIQFSQGFMHVNGTDTVIDFKTIEDIRQDYEKRVIITKIDSNFGLYSIEVKFFLLPDSHYPGLFEYNTFDYVLYKQDDKFYKIDGFMISEITEINRYGFPFVISKYIAGKSYKKFSKHIDNRSTDKIRDYLSISVLKKLVDLGYNGYINYKPYVKNITCW